MKHETGPALQSERQGAEACGSTPTLSAPCERTPSIWAAKKPALQVVVLAQAQAQTHKHRWTCQMSVNTNVQVMPSPAKGIQNHNASLLQHT
eukprot:4842572-Amphidinium_carterae.2